DQDRNKSAFNLPKGLTIALIRKVLSEPNRNRKRVLSAMIRQAEKISSSRHGEPELAKEVWGEFGGPFGPEEKPIWGRLDLVYSALVYAIGSPDLSIVKGQLNTSSDILAGNKFLALCGDTFMTDL
ncbi:MAG: hypothetical protein ACI9BD_000149, partial [Candidatus Marinamargulisbacteria bacterium]